jgi:hypothetical protein
MGGAQHAAIRINFGDDSLAVRQLHCSAGRRRKAQEGAGRGVGTTSCSQYAQLYKTDPKITEQVFAAWAHGFMTGFNFSTVREHHFRDMSAKTVEVQNAHIRMYCNAHPLASYVQAVLDFFSTLPQRPGTN